MTPTQRLRSYERVLAYLESLPVLGTDKVTTTSVLAAISAMKDLIRDATTPLPNEPYSVALAREQRAFINHQGLEIAS